MIQNRVNIGPGSPVSRHRRPGEETISVLVATYLVETGEAFLVIVDCPRWA
jgi:hypothetical protein